MKIFNKIIGKATKITERFTPKLQITQICERVYHCPYPTDPTALPPILKALSPQNIQIWNLSEYSYSKEITERLEKMGFEINELTYEFYSSMPLTTSITEINKIHAFLKSSDGNYALVHCQENKSRSVLFLAAYLYLSGKISDIATALATVNQKLGIDSNETVYSSQHALLRNIANYHKDSSFINKQQLKLLKVIINQAPKIPEVVLNQQQPLSILVQIRRNGAVIYKKVTKQFGQGQIVQFNLKDENIVLSDDCLFSFKYVFREKIYPVMRIQLNTNFVFNCFLRVPMQEIDFCKNVTFKTHAFTDFLFLAVKDKYSELSKLEGHKGVSVDVKEKSLKKQPVSQPEPVIKPSDDIAVQEQKHVFDINDEMLGKDELDEKQTEQKLNKLLISMAMKKAEVEEDIKQVENQDQEQENSPQVLQAEDSNKQASSKPSGSELVREKSNEEFKQLEPVVVKNKGITGDEEEEMDMDDYLNKLEEQAEDS